MGKISEEVSKCYDEDSSFSNAFDKMNNQLKKLKSTNCDLDLLIEEYEKSEEIKVMVIDRVRHIESDGEVTHHIRLLYQDGEGFSVQCTQQIFDIGNKGTMIHINFIEQIQQLAYLGYRLYQSKTWEEKEVQNLFSVD